jgi:hypothetical protein
MAFNLADFPEAFELPVWVTQHSAWREHSPIAPIIIKLLRPRTFVELGTHAGDSYVAFCHAVKMLGTGTQCTAIDTWQGDSHTGQYGPEFLNNLRAFHDPNYGSFSRLLPSTFDAAAPAFAEGSIDLLHIDGMHTYEAVRHDYLNWLPKLSPRGVVLFHDTAERVADFGVWRLWEELASTRPSANVPHGHGLGILAVGPEQPSAFLDFLLELNMRPGLAKILEALGTRVNLLLNANAAVMNLFQCRLYLNEWQQRTGQPVSDPKPDLKVAMANSQKLGADVNQDVRQLVIDGLNLVAEVTQLRAHKA